MPMDQGEIGLPGTRIWAGLIFEDPNRELQGREGLRRLRAMSYDPTAAAIIAVHDRPIRSAAWRVEPVDDSPEQLQIADEVWWNLNEFGTQSFDDVIRECHIRFWAGFHFAEIVYDIVQSGQYAGHVGWTKLAYRSPESKWRWDVEEIDSASGAKMRELVAVTQLAPPNYRYITIPRDKLLVWIQDLEGENFDGRALIRPCWKPFFYKDYLLKIQAIGLQRGYMGIPIGSFPANFTSNEVAATQAIVENLRVSENAGVVKPDSISLTMEKIDLEGTTMQEAINYFDRQMFTAPLAEFLVLGTSGAGSLSGSLSEDQSELFLMQLNAQANYDAQIINLQPGIPRLVAYNYGDQPKYPQLVHGPVGQRDFDKLGTAIARLAQFGVLTPDDGLEDALRDQMGLPERDKAVSGEVLKNLIAQVTGTTWEMRNKPESTRVAANPKGVLPEAAPPPMLGAAPNVAARADSTADPAHAAAHQALAMMEFPNWDTAGAQQLAEAFARRPWARPRGRLTSESRQSIRATEEFVGVLQRFSHDAGKKMPKPSVWAAEHRKPYRIRGPVQAAEKSTVMKPKAKVLTAPTLIAHKHTSAIKELLLGRGPKKNGE